MLFVVELTILLQLLALPVAPNAPDDPPSGVHFSQIDFMFPNATTLNSDWGRLEVVVPEFTDSQNLREGFLNVYTDTGWVVQNKMIDYPQIDNISLYFDLGNAVGDDVTSLSAYLEFTSEPYVNFTDGPRSTFPVGTKQYNAEGAGPLRVTSIPKPLPADLVFYPLGVTFNFTKPNTAGENVQTAKDQCFPMAIANSLQYLENEYFFFSVPHNHTLGLKGDNSLVGQLDSACNRNAPTRTTGSGVWFDDMLEGKFKYLSDNGLGNRLVHRHQGYGYGAGALPAGDFTKHGITSIDESVDGKVTFGWILEQLQNCEDVEIVIQFEDAVGNIDGGHAVRVFGAGRTKGVPWLRYKHDRLQTHNDPTDTLGLEEVQVEVRDLDGDGMMNFGSGTIEICFALAESPCMHLIWITSPFTPEFAVVVADLTGTNQTSIVLSYVSGVGTPELSMMTFNGTWWDQFWVPANKNAPFSPDIAVNPEPVLTPSNLTMVTTVNPEPVLFDPRVNPEPVLFEPNIMIRNYNGTEWTGPTPTSNCTAMGVNPTVAYYGNETWLFWENASSTPSTIRVANVTVDFDDFVSCEIGVGSQPTATVYNDELHVVFVRNETLIHKIYNGSDWSEDNPWGLIDPQPTLCDPRITVHNGLLYLTYLNGSEPGSLPYLQAFNGTTWTSSHPLENYGDLSPCNPAITSFNNTLYLFYASMKDGHIYYQTFEGELGDGTWSTPTQVPAPVHYVRVENIIPSKTVVAQNHAMDLNVNVDNIGLFNETFNVIVYYTDPDTGKNPWDIPNSTQFDDWFVRGDVNGDGYIDTIDFLLIADQTFTSNPRYDIDESGLVDTDDLLICGINYGKDIWTHFDLALPPIGKQTVEDLPLGNSTITFTWNTTGVPLGNYTISVATGGWVVNDWGGGSHDPPIIVVTILGDVNGDYKVDGSDLSDLSKAYGRTPNKPNWDPNCNLNDDNKVDASDLFELSQNYGKTT